jgi:hypothetical protein
MYRFNTADVVKSSMCMLEHAHSWAECHVQPVMKGSKMRKFGVRAVLSIAAFCVLSLLSPLSAYADSVTLNYTSNAGAYSGTGDGSSYIYPYYVTVTDGSTVTTNVSVMCIDYNVVTNVGDSWKAATEVLSSSSSAIDKEAAYIFSQLGTDTAAEVNWAEWKLFEKTSDTDYNLLNTTIAGLSSTEQLAISGLLTDAADYVSSNPDSSLYSGYEIYTADAGTNEQNMIGYETPEPSSLVLLGSGLSLAALFFYYRKRKGLRNFSADASK